MKDLLDEKTNSLDECIDPGLDTRFYGIDQEKRTW